MAVQGVGLTLGLLLHEADKKIARQMRYQAGKGSIAGVIREICEEGGVKEAELLRGGRRRKVWEVRAKIAYRLSREIGLCLAEIARKLGVGTPGVAMAVRKKERAGEK